MSFIFDVGTDIVAAQMFEIENNIMMEEDIDIIQIGLNDAKASFILLYYCFAYRTLYESGS